MSCLSPETCPARLNPAGTVVPTGIASRITKATKPSHHLKGITLREVETKYRSATEARSAYIRMVSQMRALIRDRASISFRLRNKTLKP